MLLAISKTYRSWEYLGFFHNMERVTTLYSSEEAEQRQEEFCSKNLESLILMLSTRFNAEDSLPLNVQTTLVQVLTLCSSENPDYRQAIGASYDSVALRAILSMLEEGDPLVHATLGEAIWILSFNNEHNHNFLINNHAIDKMASAFVKFVEDQENDDLSGEDKAASTLAIMWIAAALQNLAASYCKTGSGHCWWEYDFDEEEDEEESGEVGGLYLHEDSPLLIDGSRAAELIANSADGRLASILETMVCAEPMMEEDQEFWPSAATIDDVLRAAFDARLATWAVGGLLKNLSMYAESREIPLRSHDCLCALMHSEDWLESSKAEDALFRLGLGCDEHEDYDEDEEDYDEDEEEYERDEL